ncbi:MAG: hypothetical protein LC723_14060, partial [Actinobacteria bacterium]|nr:hypothetical protein [Actinomycetota bacterium]
MSAKVLRARLSPAATSILVLASILSIAGPHAAASTTTRSIPVKQDYVADFSAAAQAGIGFRFSNAPTGYYVDMRLKGYSPQAASSNGKQARFSPANGVDIVYDPTATSLKETIVMQQKVTSVFKFALSYPNMAMTTVGDHFEFAAPGQPWMFHVSRATATDSIGNSIPLETTANSDTITIRLDQAALAKAVAPITIDPTITGASTASTAGPYARKLFQTTDSRLVFFDKEDIASVPKIVYRVSSDKGATWGDPVPFADAGYSADLSVTQNEGGDFLVAYANGTTSLPRINFRKLSRNGTTWDIGSEGLVSTLGVWWRSRPTIVDRGAGPLGEQLAVGFNSYNQAYGRNEYAVYQ